MAAGSSSKSDDAGEFEGVLPEKNYINTLLVFA